jgi:hypothetical protein
VGDHGQADAGYEGYFPALLRAEPAGREQSGDLCRRAGLGLP